MVFAKLLVNETAIHSDYAMQLYAKLERSRKEMLSVTKSEPSDRLRQVQLNEKKIAQNSHAAEFSVRVRRPFSQGDSQGGFEGGSEGDPEEAHKENRLFRPQSFFQLLPATP